MTPPPPPLQTKTKTKTKQIKTKKQKTIKRNTLVHNIIKNRGNRDISDTNQNTFSYLLKFLAWCRTSIECGAVKLDL